MTAARGPAPRAGRPPRPIPRLLLLLGALAVASLASAQAMVPQELRAEATRLFRELATLRGLPSTGGLPPLVIQSREERRRFVVGELSRKYSPARLDAERRALVAWGLVPADFDLPGFLADLLAEQAAAYYDPVAKRMVLANWLTPELRRDALTHELVHVLQDRLVDLRALPRRRARPERRGRRAPGAGRGRGRRAVARREPPPGWQRLRGAARRRRPSAGDPDVRHRTCARAGAGLLPNDAHLPVRERARVRARLPAAPTVGPALGGLPGPAKVVLADPSSRALLRPARGPGAAPAARSPRGAPLRREAGPRGRAGRDRDRGGSPAVPGRLGRRGRVAGRSLRPVGSRDRPASAARRDRVGHGGARRRVRARLRARAHPEARLGRRDGGARRSRRGRAGP